MNRRTVFFGIILAVFCECSSVLSVVAQERKASVKPKGKVGAASGVVYRKLSGRAVLIGEEIHLLGRDYRKMKDISNLSGRFAEITAVSKDYRKQNPEDDFCESFKYVKIRVNGLEGIVDGRKVYLIPNDDEGFSKSFEGNTIGLTPVRNFGRGGATDEEGSISCSDRAPIIFSDKRAGYTGLVRMKENKFYDSDYPYFALKERQEETDAIENIEKSGNYYLISIQTAFHDGSATSLVRIGREPGGAYTAEILNEELTEE